MELQALKWMVDNKEYIPDNLDVNGADIPNTAAGNATRISGGDRVCIKTGITTWQVGQEVRLTITDKSSGQLLADLTIRVKSP